MRLLPYNGRIVRGSISFAGRSLVPLEEASMRAIRWKEMSIVFQGAMNSLNPVQRVGRQIAEPIILHEDADSDVALKRAGDLLELVGISRNRLNDYPHEFSGGMRQRVMIAMALACDPKLVIADEPVTALDVMIQAQILDLLERLRRELDLAMILISHDLSVLADTCEQVTIMYAGKTMESGKTMDLFTDPKHPYTQGLVGAFPDIRGPRNMPEAIPGDVPSLISGGRRRLREDLYRKGDSETRRGHRWRHPARDAPGGRKDVRRGPNSTGRPEVPRGTRRSSSQIFRDLEGEPTVGRRTDPDFRPRDSRRHLPRDLRPLAGPRGLEGPVRKSVADYWLLPVYRAHSGKCRLVASDPGFTADARHRRAPDPRVRRDRPGCRPLHPSFADRRHLALRSRCGDGEPLGGRSRSDDPGPRPRRIRRRRSMRSAPRLAGTVRGTDWYPHAFNSAATSTHLPRSL